MVAFSSFLPPLFLILFPAPTAAAYAILFAVAYFILRRRSRWLGVACGLGLIAGVGLGVPHLINKQVTADRKDLLKADRPPTRPVAPGTIVGIVSAGRGGGCGEICLALLYSGSAAGVIEAANLSQFGPGGRPLIWRIERRSQPCALPVQSDEPIRWGRTLTRERLAGHALLGKCVGSHRGPLADGSWVLEQEKLPGSAERMSLWRFQAGGRQALVARQTQGAPRQLVAPLSLSIGGSPNSGAYWTWTRVREARSRPAEFEDFITFDPSGYVEPKPEALRAALDAWLARPDIRDEGIARLLDASVLPLMSGDTREDADFARYLKLIKDPRRDAVTDMRMAQASFPERALELSAVALSHAAQLPPFSDMLYRMDDVFESFPPGTFAQTPPLMLSMIRSSERRRRMPSLVARLADAGPPGARLLLALFRSTLEAGTDGKEIDVDTVRATLDGLCRLGPAIPPAFEIVEREVRENKDLESSFRNTAWWAAVRVRLGRPPLSIRPPRNVQQSWVDEYNRRVERADCSF